jgi:hypothetical protein
VQLLPPSSYRMLHIAKLKLWKLVHGSSSRVLA